MLDAKSDIQVTKRNGTKEPFDIKKIDKALNFAVRGTDIEIDQIKKEVVQLLRPNIPTSDIHNSLILASENLLTKGVKNFSATYVASRLLLLLVYKKTKAEINKTDTAEFYTELKEYLNHGVEKSVIDKKLIDGRFDLDQLDSAINVKRDLRLTYLSVVTLADRYLLRTSDTQNIFEAPQHLFMRVAMGLSLNEENPTAKAIETYNVISQNDAMFSTPTLFNAGTTHSQLSSCFLNTVADELSTDEENRVHQYASIYGTIEECARLSKYAGGIGTDWTRVRPEGTFIKGTQGKSSGTIPYLAVYNQTAVAVNQGGKRKGSFAPYLEVWHPDILGFIDLRKETGDPRMRTPDIFPANWIPDLFMQRMLEEKMWSLFDPNLYPELHELYGEDFKKRYEELEAQGKYKSQISAVELWRKMLEALFETGNPWITFKDACNLRNPQSHCGVIHTSNLCTEITLNTSDTETAVCNLASINLARMVLGDKIDFAKLKTTIRTMIRALDNVIDINFYPSSRAKASNTKHRPIGLGVMGYADMLVQLGIHYDSVEHLELADDLFEAISYYAIEASHELAMEKGSYSSFNDSKWSQGILPIDTANPNAGGHKGKNFDWNVLREKVKKGMRNSNVMAIAPTATISNICGTTACTEVSFNSQYTKLNLSGSFIQYCPTFRHGRPELIATAFEVDQKMTIRSAAVRQKWIDQSQSTNLFAKQDVTGRELHDWYVLAWKLGLKTTYYLRSQSNRDVNEYISPMNLFLQSGLVPTVKGCSIDNPDCESCQ